MTTITGFTDDSEMKRKHISPSWEVSEALWQRVEPLIPAPQRDQNREYVRKPGAGRKPLPPRQVFAGIVYVLRTGIQWKALPTDLFGSPSALHRHFLRWQAAGFFERLWRAGLLAYDETSCIAWKWQSIDGTLSKAPLAREAVGPNPTDRGKKWKQAEPAGGWSRHPLVAGRQRRRNAGCLAGGGDVGQADRSASEGVCLHPPVSERGERGHRRGRLEGRPARRVYACVAAARRDDRPYP